MADEKIELERLMRCPVNWDQETGIGNWEWSILHLDWLHCLGEQFPEATDVPVTPEDYEGIFEDTYEHDHLLKNLRVYRPKAKELYEKRAGRMAGWRFLTPLEHDKHIRSTIARDQVTEQSKTTWSLFFRNHASEELRLTFWTWFRNYFDRVISDASLNFFVSPMIMYGSLTEPEEYFYNTSLGKLWQKFLTLPRRRIAINTVNPIGASEGEPTSFLCYDIHIDARVAHAFPVSEAEAQRIMEDGDVQIVDSLTS